jgi:hypothetical protein
MTRLLQIVTEWKSQNEAQVKEAERTIVQFRQERADEILRQQAKRAEAERIKRLSAKDMLAMSDDEIRRAFHVSSVYRASSHFEDRWGIHVTDGIHPAISIMQQLDAPTLLPSLTPELKHQLQQFLGAVKLDVSCMTHDAAWARCRTNIVGCSRFGCVMRSSSACDGQDQPKLLYKATRDGFTPAAFYRHVAQQGSTLTLIKVGPCKQTFNVSECDPSHARESHRTIVNDLWSPDGRHGLRLRCIHRRLMAESTREGRCRCECV